MENRRRSWWWQCQKCGQRLKSSWTSSGHPQVMENLWIMSFRVQAVQDHKVGT